MKILLIISKFLLKSKNIVKTQDITKVGDFLKNLTKWLKDKDKDKDKDKEEKIFYISMNWEGCNPNAEIKVSEASEGYYTFGEKGYENVKAKGFRNSTNKASKK